MPFEKNKFADALKRQKKIESLKKMWVGGKVEGGQKVVHDGKDAEFNLDDQVPMHYNSSGEPHTNNELEEEKPMPFMANGGRVGDSNFKPSSAGSEHDQDMSQGGERLGKSNAEPSKAALEQIIKMAKGGLISGDKQPSPFEDDEMDDNEEEDPSLSMGGYVHKMVKGGEVPSFAKALKAKRGY